MNYNEPTSMRTAFGEALLELGGINSEIVVLTADLSDAIKVKWFSEKYPERFFQMGVSENDMIGTAAGMALNGKIPFATTFAIFISSLANQAVRLSVGYNHANVKLVASHGGVTIGGDGASHQAFEDFALMRMIPGMTVLSPCDAIETYKATKAISEYNGPIYMRVGRIKTDIITNENTSFNLGKINLLRKGKDIAIFATGLMVSEALKAAAVLEKDGINPFIINVHTLKPIDVEGVLSLVRKCKAVVTAEEHSILGGLGGTIAELLAKNNPLPIEMVGVEDVFGESGEPEEILRKYNLNSEDIVHATKKALTRSVSE